MDNKTELYHHGIKGMRWGRRRYQNPDGSLTPEGKARYGDPEPDHEDSTRARAKTARTMSDKELRDAINRVQMEKQYEQLTKKEKSRGRQMVEDALIEAGKNTLRSATESLAKASIGVVLRKMGMNATEGGAGKAFIDQMITGLNLSNMKVTGKIKKTDDSDAYNNKEDEPSNDQTNGKSQKKGAKKGASAVEAAVEEASRSAVVDQATKPKSAVTEAAGTTTSTPKKVLGEKKPTDIDSTVSTSRETARTPSTPSEGTMDFFRSITVRADGTPVPPTDKKKKK